MPPFTTLEEMRSYALLNFTRNENVHNYTSEEVAHNYVWRLCRDSSMTMDLLSTILYRIVYKHPFIIEPLERAVYVEYLQAMKVGEKHDAL